MGIDQRLQSKWSILNTPCSPIATVPLHGSIPELQDCTLEFPSPLAPRSALLAGWGRFEYEL